MQCNLIYQAGQNKKEAYKNIIFKDFFTYEKEKHEKTQFSHGSFEGPPQDLKALRMS